MPLIREKVATTNHLELMINIIAQRDGLISFKQISTIWRTAMKCAMPLNAHEFAYLKDAWLMSQHPPRPSIPEATWG
jgi:hypothetical protein